MQEGGQTRGTKEDPDAEEILCPVSIGSEVEERTGERTQNAVEHCPSSKARTKSTQRVYPDYIYVSPWESSSEVFFIGLLLVLLASLCTRLYKIAEPSHVA